ncbi:MAG: hypothetical protein J3R72DRAFT_425506 [Linnemannia gamsii]|nr:MAG: hypothetical protein J3R72DRAFT_425506 [Linnemannia gamsii]
MLFSLLLCLAINSSLSRPANLLDRTSQFLVDALLSIYVEQRDVARGENFAMRELHAHLDDHKHIVLTLEADTISGGLRNYSYVSGTDVDEGDSKKRGLSKKNAPGKVFIIRNRAMKESYSECLAKTMKRLS